MNQFIEFFAKYWLTIVFGFITAWLGKKVEEVIEVLDSIYDKYDN